MALPTCREHPATLTFLPITADTHRTKTQSSPRTRAHGPRTCGTHPATTTFLPAALPAAMSVLMASWLGPLTVQLLISHSAAASRCASGTSLRWVQQLVVP